MVSDAPATLVDPRIQMVRVHEVAGVAVIAKAVQVTQAAAEVAVAEAATAAVLMTAAVRLRTEDVVIVVVRLLLANQVKKEVEKSAVAHNTPELFMPLLILYRISYMCRCLMVHILCHPHASCRL